MSSQNGQDVSSAWILNSIQMDVIRNLKTIYTSHNRCLITDVKLIQQVFGDLRVSSLSDRRHRIIIQCLFQHFVGWNLLNAKIYPHDDCILTFITSCAPHLVIPFLELDPPERYERPNANALGERGLPAVAWLVWNSHESVNSLITFNYLVKRTSDDILRLCFTSGYTFIRRYVLF